ncbi:serine hydrolase domain-containing protein [Anaerobacillus sp. MEB173]|uniref:serine hydrolase domain-containing protein n=1 Tax=Anaerobacillus sp. MEB173 TaxID=3383345 RepID=UPI003F8E4AFE
MIKVFLFILGFGLLLGATYTSSENTVETTWEQYQSPEEAGWSTEKLNKAKEYYRTLDSTAALAIYNGKILFSWGDITSSTNAHSVRKSFLNALYGIDLSDNGDQFLEQTLAELSIDDRQSLSDEEKQATVYDLLSSRSAVYHPAGEESLHMKRSRPKRGSHSPGSYYYYNNWDFNVLGTIYNHETNSDLFIQFKEKIADRIGMEDFDLRNTTYKFDSNSYHPSYLFRVSARDMARFGQLYLQDGMWNSEQIIPKEWIKTSTTLHAPVPSNNTYGYGLLWWVAEEGPYKDLGLYSAVGRYGQSIDIIPEKNLVFVHRVNSNRAGFKFLNKKVSQAERLQLLSMILAAKEQDINETET